MAHYAKLNENNVVEAVIVIENDYEMKDDVFDENAGIAFCQYLTGHAHWKKTSYNGNIRKNYAGLGYTYDPDRDAFIPPCPDPSWTLNEETCQWDEPI